jgi:hypothetical protein
MLSLRLVSTRDRYVVMVHLTFVPWIDHKLSDHCLNDSNIAIQSAADKATSERHPEIWREANYQQ